MKKIQFTTPADAVKSDQTMGSVLTQVLTMITAEPVFEAEQLIAKLGQALAVNRARLYWLVDEGRLRLASAWQAGGSFSDSSCKRVLETSKLPWWMNRLSQGKIISIRDTTQLPAQAADEWQLLQPGRPKALLVVPLSYAGKLHGLLGFEDTVQTRVWSEADLRILQPISYMIAFCALRLQAEQELRTAQQEKEIILNAMEDQVIYYDSDHKIIWANKAMLKDVGVSLAEIVGRHCYEIRFGADKPCPGCPTEQVLLTRLPNEAEVESPDGRIWHVQGYPICNNDGEVTRIVEVTRDITKQRKAEEQIYQLTVHDKLTGLYNRFYFDQKLQELDQRGAVPWSVIFGDVNGLKLINDAFGHKEGDRLLKRLAGVLQASCRREKDIVARWGGDEFAIILPGANAEIAQKVCERIREACRQECDSLINLSISLGAATKTRPEQKMNTIFQQAETRMYQNKFIDSLSVRNSNISALQQALAEKTHETDVHARRIKVQAVQLGAALGLSPSELNDLALAALLHDIGKVGIPDKILTKEGALTPEEKEQMKQHPEIGYRIVMASYGLPKVAEAVLAHHEWWDGTGYPLGLKGEDIPLKARIIAIVDAYDALTQERPYRKPRGHQQALAEIEAAAGTQFDPKLVDIYLQLMRAVK
ncbi:MAG: diguanylate cyclase [Firmicutes bacterium]|nr:diguanylate cyclase [Bacillota bacterium]